MKDTKRNLLTAKKLVVVEWLAVMLLVGLLSGLLIVSCTVQRKQSAATVTFAPTSLPAATLTPEAVEVQPTQTAIPTEIALQEGNPTSTPTISLETPVLSPTETLIDANACHQWPPQRVLIFSVDALRPDAVSETTAAPFMLDYALRGSYTWHAQTTMPSITMTGHLSMLSGYDAPTHGIIDNQIWQTPEAKTSVDTIFQRAKEKGLTTVLISGKGHLLYIQRAGFLDYSYVDKAAKDSLIADKAISYIQDNDFDLMFVHFANVDKAGHTYSWMSTEYLQAVTVADSMIKRVLGALEDKGILDSTLIIINADHGGTGISHGDAHIPTNRTIPWMIGGPCVKSGHQIEQSVNVFDTAAMALWGLGIDIPADLDGKLVCEVFSSPVSSQCLEAEPKK